MCLGIPGQIISISDTDRKLAIVEVSGVRREINVACILQDAGDIEELVGAWALVHVGFAMSRIDEEEAAKTLDILTQLGEAQAEIDAMTEGQLAMKDPS
ncbi:MAG: HypC/HybG/HupF family hydrogenase formation chaperone [Parvularcula sp.]